MKDIGDIALEMRPKTLDQIVGNKSTVEILKSKLKTGTKFPKAVLIHGDPGCGKTTLARIIFSELHANEDDIQEYNMATDGLIATAREVQEKVNFMPGLGKVNGWLFDESHKARADTLSGFLKPLEDSPDHNHFIFCTSDRSGFLGKFTDKERKAFLRRCVEIPVSVVDDDDGFNMLIDCLEYYDIPAAQVPDNVIETILKYADGVPAKMYKDLETIINIETPDKMIDILLNINSDTKENTEDIRQLCRDMIAGNWAACVESLKLLKSNQDIESVKNQICGYMQAVLFNDISLTQTITNKRAYATLDLLNNSSVNSRIYGLTHAVRYVCTIK